MDDGQRRTERYLLILLLGAAILGAFVVALDWREARRLAGALQWPQVLLAMGWVVASYWCLSHAFVATCRVFGVRFRFLPMMEIAFISATLNHIVSAGGVAGHSLRMLAMRQHGAAVSDVLAASLVHAYLATMGMFVLLPIGLGYLWVEGVAPASTLYALTVVAGLGAVIAGAGTTLVVSARARRTGVRLGTRLTVRLLSAPRASAVAEALETFDASMARGTAVVQARPMLGVVPVLLIACDWVSATMAYWYCLRALGANVGPGVLVTGFGSGVAAGFVSALPGGLGVQDGSMSALFALLGVPLERAVLAAVLFRVLYYALPFAISLAMYYPLIRRVRALAAAQQDGTH